MDVQLSHYATHNKTHFHRRRGKRNEKSRRANPIRPAIWEGDRVRFDDKLATVLARPLADAGARAAAWRQIIDILAQDRNVAIDWRQREAAFALLRRIRPEVPEQVRADTVLAVAASRRLAPAIVGFVAEEPPAVSAPLIVAVQLPDEDWLDLLPALPATSRALLRHRRDLSPAVRVALDSFGSSDFVIGTADSGEQLEKAAEKRGGIDVAVPSAADEVTVPGIEADWSPEPEDRPPGEGDPQIRDLLRRIAAYRDRPEELRAEPPSSRSVAPRIEDFRFETGPDGVIRWVEGAPRGPLVGISIAAAAEQYGHGVDGHAAGAYRRRASFRDARLIALGDGEVCGEWRISAVPFFDHLDGRFTGYRGTARRPRADESAAHLYADRGLYGSGLAPDSLRQLVHELRTPLNAIVGFAEMIEHQMLGPAGLGYRDRAGDIAEQGRRLLAAVDDLDMAARLESRRLREAAGAVDTAMLIERLHNDYEAAARPRGVRLAFRIAKAVPPVDADPVTVERMFSRLLAATIGLAETGETIFATLRAEGHEVRLSVSRPRLLEARDEKSLLDPGYSPDGDWPDAPALGLGFALRLIRNLAISARGNLLILPDSFELRLPTRSEEEEKSGQGNV